MIGQIPEKIHMFLRPTAKRPQNIGRRNYALSQNVAYQGRPAFPVSNHLKPEAATWAKAKSWAGPGYQEVVLDNIPKEGYRVVGAEQRGEGGRAWIVLTPEGHIVDMREDVFTPILLQHGIPAGGLIPGKFQWVLLGTQLRLECTTSEQFKEYDLLVEPKVKQRSRKKTIPVKELEVGRVYLFDYYGSPHHRIYLGKGRMGGKLKTLWVQVWVTLDGERGRLKAPLLTFASLDQGFAMSGSRALGISEYDGKLTLPIPTPSAKWLWWDGNGDPIREPVEVIPS